MINSKTIKFFSLITIVSFLSSSCIFTPKLYKITDPNQYVRVEYDQITEEALIGKNIKYFKDDKSESFFIEKSAFQKFQDYSLRAIGTPVTVALDAATITVVAVGTLIGASLIGEAKKRGREAEQDEKFKPF